MMKKNIITVIVILLIASCGTNNNKTLIMRGAGEVFSLGLHDIGEQIKGSSDVIIGSWTASSVLSLLSDTAPDNRIVMVGHSAGADQSTYISISSDRPIEALFLLDPVFPADIPSNVKECWCWYVGDISPIKAKDGNNITTFFNFKRSDSDHFSLDDNKEVQYKIVKEIKRIFCNGDLCLTGF